jgi:hypothetical protein
MAEGMFVKGLRAWYGTSLVLRKFSRLISTFYVAAAREGFVEVHCGIDAGKPAAGDDDSGLHVRRRASPHIDVWSCTHAGATRETLRFDTASGGCRAETG